MRQGQDTHFLQLVLRQLAKLGEGLQQFSQWADRRPTAWQDEGQASRLGRFGGSLTGLTLRALQPGGLHSDTRDGLSACNLDNGISLSLRKAPCGSRPGLCLCVEGSGGRTLTPDEYYWLPHEVADADLPSLACRIAPWVARAIVELSQVAGTRPCSAHAA